jgi:two-component system OmpR family sensor kinase
MQHRIWPMGIRMQLTLWYMLVFALLMLLFGTIFYINLRVSLTRSFDDSLRLRTAQIAAGISEQKGSITIQDLTGELPGSFDSDEAEDNGTPDAQDQQSQPEQFPDVDIATLVRVLDTNGHIVYITPAFRALNVPSISVNQALDDAEWQGIVSAHNGQSVRLDSVPLINNGKVFGVVQVGASLTELDNTLQRVVIEYLLIAPFVLLLGIVGSYWLAAHAFAPINRLTRAAQHIEAGDLHQRVTVPHAGDEVQALALTFNEMIERLDKAFTQQRRFVADASHELRTPVAAIRSMTDVVLAQRSPVSREEYIAVLNEINIEAERLGHLINDLLALARADEGETLLEWQPVQLDLLASEVAATIEPLAAERGITLEVGKQESARGASIWIKGDEARLIQAILNLLDNALVYTNAGGKVKLSVEIKDRNACLTVSDTGIGIGSEHLEHIFKRFYRADPARSRGVGGNGLGLAIVDWVIRAHGGTISVQSRIGEGSTFCVMLPLAV